MKRLSGGWGRVALLTAALIWGSSFIVMKNAVEGVPVFMLLGIRFTVGCLLLMLIFHRRLKTIGKKQLPLWIPGGFCLQRGYIWTTQKK